MAALTNKSLISASMWAQNLRFLIFWTLSLGALSYHVRSLEAMLEVPLIGALFTVSAEPTLLDIETKVPGL